MQVLKKKKTNNQAQGSHPCRVEGSKGYHHFNSISASNNHMQGLGRYAAPGKGHNEPADSHLLWAKEPKPKPKPKASSGAAPKPTACAAAAPKPAPKHDPAPNSIPLSEEQAALSNPEVAVIAQQMAEMRQQLQMLTKFITQPKVGKEEQEQEQEQQQQQQEEEDKEEDEGEEPLPPHLVF